MRVHIIYPRFERFLEAYPELGEIPPVIGLWKYRMPPALGSQILATMMPSDVEWKIIDQNVTPVDLDEPVDLVAISYFTPQASSAYELGDAFLARGVPVVMGGMHPSILPDDAEKHASSVCIGEAEGTWLEILADARAGQLKRRYGPSQPPPEAWVKPRRDLFDIERDYHWYPALVQVARGCPWPCPYCNIPIIQGKTVRVRDPIDAAEEVIALGDRELYITEDVVMLTNKAMRNYSEKLFGGIADRGGARLFLTSSLVMNVREPFLDLLARAGTRSLYFTFGFDPISRGVYAGDRVKMQQAADIVRRVEDRGIRFYAAFGAGFDGDEPSCFDHILDFCEQAQVQTAEFFIATPFPNTPMWKTVTEEGRLHHTNFREFNGAHVVFRPKRMTEEELVQGFLHMWRSYWEGRDVDRALDCFEYRSDSSAY